MFRIPSINAIVECFDCTRAEARQVRAIGHATDVPDLLCDLIMSDDEKPDPVPATAAYVRRTDDSSPFSSSMKRITVALHAMDSILKCSGVECLGYDNDPRSVPMFEYLNVGDPYIATLIYSSETDCMMIRGYGDVLDRVPKRLQ